MALTSAEERYISILIPKKGGKKYIVQYIVRPKVNICTKWKEITDG